MDKLGSRMSIELDFLFSSIFWELFIWSHLGSSLTDWIFWGLICLHIFSARSLFISLLIKFLDSSLSSFWPFSGINAQRRVIKTWNNSRLFCSPISISSRNSSIFVLKCSSCYLTSLARLRSSSSLIANLFLTSPLSWRHFLQSRSPLSWLTNSTAQPSWVLHWNWTLLTSC